MAFLDSILKNSSNHKTPFEHWELNRPLTDGQVQEIVNADIANPIEHNLNYDGTRAIDGGAAVHFISGKYHKSLQFYPDSHVYQVSFKDNIVKEIVELKLQHPLSEEGKLRIQKLQQKLNKDD